VAEIDFYSSAHYGFAVKNAPYPNGSFFVKERDNYASETLERSPRMDGGGRVYEVFDGLNIVGAKDLRVVQIRDE